MSERRPFPIWLAGPAALAVLVVVFPLAALAVRTPWSSIGTLLASDESRSALALSAVTASITTLLCVVLGTPLGIVLGRAETRLAAAIRVVVLLPVVLPPVAGGVALLLAYGRNGVIGGPLDDAFDVTIPFTTAAVILAQLLVALPFTIIAVEAATRTLDPQLEETAATLRSAPNRTFWRVTVPALRGAIVAGASLSFARALGELGATIVFAGSLPDVTRTAPLEVLLQLDSASIENAAAISVALLGFSIAVLAALRLRWLPAATRRQP